MLIELSQLLNFLSICCKNKILESKFILVRKSLLTFLDILWFEGLLLAYTIQKNYIQLFFKVDFSTKTALNRISTFNFNKSIRCFLTWFQIKEILLNDFRVILIVRTHKGIFSNFKLFQMKLGGELIIKIN